MMTKTQILLLVCFLLQGFSMQTKAQDLSLVQQTQIAKQVDSVFQGMISSAENLEYDKLASGVDDSYQAGFIGNGGYYPTFDSMVTNLKSRSQGVLRQNITLEKEKITVLCKDIVLLTASGNARVELFNGNSFPLKFFWSFVYKKEGDNWRVIQSHQSATR